jgi:signal transduction histidine kinase
MVVTLLSGQYDYYRVWAGLLATVAFVSLMLVFWRSRQGRELSPDQWLVGMVALFTLVTGIRDFLVVQLNFSGDADLRWTSISSLVLMLTLGWVLLQRTTASVREVGRLNATLAQTVAQREAELRTAFNQLRESERQRAVESERRRLMRDMHDGLGSQLVQTLNAVRSRGPDLDHKVIERMLHHALEELRITLDSLEPMDGDLPTILGTLRQRIAPALEAAGIELDWQVQEVPEVPSLDARGVMHLFRCIQEVFANVVKHAQASRVTVRTWAQDGEVCLSVADNGRGFPPTSGAAQGGRGLNNIRVRAEKIGARVAFRNATPGTEVVLTFSLGPRYDPPDTQMFGPEDL